MTSNAEKGRRFQECCRKALEDALGISLESEISISAFGMKAHKFDLASADRRVIAECKAFGWTVSGNTPSAKISNLREAIQNLLLLPEGLTRILVVKRDPHPKRRETLGAYFVRLNAGMLGSVIVLEMPEEGGDFSCIHGKIEAKGKSQIAIGGSLAPQQIRVSVEELGAIRRELRRIIDWREGRRSPETALAKRVSAMRNVGSLPANIANLMHTLLGYRNIAEYEDHILSDAESVVIQSALQAIRDWARREGYKFDSGLPPTR